MVFDVNGNSNALDKSIQGAYLHLRHYNYNNRPVYYKSSRDAGVKDMYLYFGSINNIFIQKNCKLLFDFSSPFAFETLV